MADTEDKDFKEFCKALKTEPMDVETIKEGIRKFGFRQLSDSQKAMFQAAMFPTPTPSSKKENEKLGFQNLKKINQTLRIVQELYKAKAIDKDEMLAFLTEPQRIPVKDKDGNVSYRKGKSLLATVALNTYAIEFKDARFDRKLKQDGISDELRNDLNTMRAKLYENAAVATEIQETLGKLDAETLNEAFNTEEIFNNGDENTGRRFKYNDLAKKSFMMKDNYDKAARFAEQHQSDAVRTQAENTPTPEPVRFGGMPENSDTLTFTAQPENLNVTTNTPTPPTTPQNDDDLTENPAQLEKPDRDSKRGKSNFDFKPVAEQDLIKYMYNAWFLGLINFSLKKAFSVTDEFVDYLCGDTGKTPARSPIATRNNAAQQPATPAAPTTPAGTPQAAQDGTPLSPEANQFSQQMRVIADLEASNTLNEMKRVLKDAKVLTAITKCIEANIGKDPDKWTGNADFNPLNHKAFITQLNKSFFANKSLFRKNLATLMKNPQILHELMGGQKIRLCAYLATMDYVKNNPGKSLDGNKEAAAKIRKGTMVKFQDLIETTSQIAREKEIEFNHKNNLAPNAELSEKQLAIVANDTANEVSLYLQQVCLSGNKLKNLMCEHQVATDATQKKLLEQEIRVKQEEFDKLYNKYRSPDDEAQLTETRQKGKTEPMGVVEAAKAEQAGERKQQAWEGDIGAQRAQNAAEKENNTKRKVKVNEFKRRIEGKYQAKQARVAQKRQESR